MLDALDVDVAVGDERSLPVEFSVKLSVLSLTVVINRALLINLRSESLYEADVCVDARLVVLIHSSLLLIQSAEILLHIHQLVLQLLVVALALPQICGLLHELGDHALFLGRRSGAVTTGTVGKLVADDGARFLLVHLGNIESRLARLLWLVSLRHIVVVSITALGAVGAEWARVAHLVGWHRVFLHFQFFIRYEVLEFDLGILSVPL